MKVLKRRALTAVAVASGFAGLGGWVAWLRLEPGQPSLDASDLLYALNLPDHLGKGFALDRLRGKVVVLNFWASWCPPCIEEMPELAELHREIAPRNGTVIGIGIDSPSNIRQFAENRPVPYPLLVAGLGGTELAKRFGNQAGALPFTAVLDPQGRITLRKLGRIRLAELRSEVNALIRNRSS
ncbi:MAG: TlpA disulfide reductase family protein [Quisquiliibacterium sp.]